MRNTANQTNQTITKGKHDESKLTAKEEQEEDFGLHEVIQQKSKLNKKKSKRKAQT